MYSVLIYHWQSLQRDVPNSHSPIHSRSGIHILREVYYNANDPAQYVNGKSWLHWKIDVEIWNEFEH